MKVVGAARLLLAALREADAIVQEEAPGRGYHWDVGPPILRQPLGIAAMSEFRLNTARNILNSAS